MDYQWMFDPKTKTASCEKGKVAFYALADGGYSASSTQGKNNNLSKNEAIELAGNACRFLASKTMFENLPLSQK